jgi:serine/threonine-protein kinase RsbW
VKFALVFRTEPVSVPVMRRVLGDTLRGLGVDEESVYDILLAATEACTNVLIHGGRHVRGYAVVTSVGAVRCQVEVAGEGAGAPLHETGQRGTGLRPGGAAVSPSADGASRPTGIAQLAESGRGLAVMRACVDNVTLDSSPDRGTVVTLRKHLRWSHDAPLRQYRAAS